MSFCDSAHADLGRHRAVADDARRRADDLLVEARDTVGRALAHRELDVRHAERQPRELLLRRMQPEPIPPRAGDVRVARLDVVGELRALQPLGRGGQAGRQLVEVGNHQAGEPAQHLRRRRRQVELRVADVDPHVLEPDHEVRVTRQAQRDHVELRGQLLVGHTDVDVLEVDHVAEIFLGPIEGLSRHGHGAPPGKIVEQLQARR